MREWLLGAVGAVALYSTTWARTVPDRPEVAGETPAAASCSATKGTKNQIRSRAREQRAEARQPAPAAKQPWAEPAQTPPAAAGARAARDALPDVGGPTPSAREHGRDERPDELPVEIPARLRKTFERLSELQQLGPDPSRLAARLQGMDVDPAEVEELREFARRFVDLPPERVNLNGLR